MDLYILGNQIVLSSFTPYLIIHTYVVVVCCE